MVPSLGDSGFSIGIKEYTQIGYQFEERAKCSEPRPVQPESQGLSLGLSLAKCQSEIEFRIPFRVAVRQVLQLEERVHQRQVHKVRR